jgi:hypothetical protein
MTIGSRSERSFDRARRRRKTAGRAYR